MPCGPIYDIEQVYADPQVRSRDMAVALEHPKAGAIRNIGVAVKLSIRRGRCGRRRLRLVSIRMRRWGSLGMAGMRLRRCASAGRWIEDGIGGGSRLVG